MGSRRSLSLRRKDRHSDLQRGLPSAANTGLVTSPQHRDRSRRNLSKGVIRHVGARFCPRERLFVFPDRYVSTPQPQGTLSCTLQISQSPGELSKLERRLRHKNPIGDPFRANHNSRAIEVLRVQTTHSGRTILAPHYTPSFASRPRENPDVVESVPRRNRVVTPGTVWSVGGRRALTATQLHGVDSGNGEVQAAGTNAPMVSVQFLGQKTADDDTQLQRARLALALEIDTASRVLQIASTSPVPPRSTQSKRSAIVWQNSS